MHSKLKYSFVKEDEEEEEKKEHSQNSFNNLNKQNFKIVLNKRKSIKSI